MTDDDLTAGLRRLNTQPADAARSALLDCLRVPGWVDALVAGRPYPDPASALARSSDILRGLTAAEVEQALSGHPRIGERPGAGHNVAASRREQSAVGTAPPAISEAIRAGNVDYERRFGRVFVIRAAGRSAQDVLSELRRRLANSPRDEAREVADQLREITAIRLEHLLLDER